MSNMNKKSTKDRPNFAKSGEGVKQTENAPGDKDYPTKVKGKKSKSNSNPLAKAAQVK